MATVISTYFLNSNSFLSALDNVNTTLKTIGLINQNISISAGINEPTVWYADLKRQDAEYYIKDNVSNTLLIDSLVVGTIVSTNNTMIDIAYTFLYAFKGW